MSAAYEDAAAYLTGKAGASSARGAEIAEQAAKAGDAACAALVANLAGAGFERPQSWSVALGWLARAAELGSGDAVEQLEILSGQRGDVQTMRAAVDTDAWVRARTTQMLLGRPRVGASTKFLDRRLCERFVRRAEPLQAAARVYNPGTGQPMQHDIRSNTTALFTIVDLDLPMLLIRKRIADTMGVPVLHLERCSIFRYEPGQRFTSHVDFLDPRLPGLAQEIATRGQRTLTFLIYLNEGFEGGETAFLAIGRRFRGGPGDALFFHNVDEAGAPDPFTLHEGSPPTSGRKWLFSQFIRNRPQLPG